MFKKNNILLSLVVCTGVFSSQLQAASTSNNMTLQWQGTVPTKPAANGSWSFVSSLDQTQAFTPSLGAITVSNASSGAGKALTLTPVNFSIKGKNTGLTASSKVKAYLSSPVSFTGLNATSTSNTAPTLTLSVSGQELRVGSNSAVDAASVASSGTTNSVDISITGVGSLPENSFTEGDIFSVAATIVFTADVT